MMAMVTKLILLATIAIAASFPADDNNVVAPTAGDAGDANLELASKKKKEAKKEQKEEKKETEKEKEPVQLDSAKEEKKDDATKEAPVTGDSSNTCVKMNNFMNAQYTIEVGLGSPPQNFPLVPDTGSSDLVVSSTKCMTCPPNKGQFDGNKSTTFIETPLKQQLAYGQGVVACQKSYDNVKIGATEVKNVSFLELEMQMLRGFEHSSYDGIIGLSKLKYTQNNETSFMEDAKVDQFGMCLSKIDGEPGVFTVNGIHPEVDPSKLKMVDVIGEHHWAVQLNGVKSSSGGVESTICKDGCAAIVDSGTTLVGVPGVWMKAIEAQTGVINEDCSNMKDLPNIKFTLGNTEVSLPPEMYVMNITADHQDIIVKFAEERFKGNSVAFNNIKEKLKARAYPNVCMSTFMDLDLNSQYGPVFILGMPFFRQYYTVFNRKDQKIGFVDANFPCNDCSARSKDANGAINMAATSKPIEVLSTDIESLKFPYWAWPQEATAAPPQLML